nr:topoisomerase 2 [Cucujiformia]
VNAADNKQRDAKMNTIKINIDKEKNEISVYNNGRGIDIAMHKTENVYVPTLIFGHLLTGANFDDDQKKVVGGRNGYGAKLCNIFSTKFVVETSSKNDGKSFKQVWKDNMSTAGEVIIKDAAKEDFTRITFCPDLSKFGMEELTNDMVALMTRRAYDIAGSAKNVNVFLNGNKIKIKDFKEYVNFYLKGKVDEAGEELKCAYEKTGERWEIAVAMSEKGFQQVSFVNSIATTKGGRHVDHVTDLVIAKLSEAVKKKNKDKIAIKPFQLKNHLWVFVNCLIENPAFDSQTKESLNTQVKNFGSKCTPSDKFFTAALKTGIVESIMNWVKFKADALMGNKCAKNKQSKIMGIPKLEDANEAGKAKSMDYTLILTEGDSAKTLVVSGFGVPGFGRDYFGVFPLRGKLLNVREATPKQISENAEITAILKIMGLQYRKKYETLQDLKTLRYGKLMIMTDQDQDGS